MTSDPIDMQKTRKCNRQANYQLFLLRRSGHNIQRNYASKFLFNFEQWIEACQFHGLCPKLSNAKEFQQNEVMWADNAMPFSEWEGRVAANIYQVQLHIGYYNIYNINPMEGY